MKKAVFAVLLFLCGVFSFADNRDARYKDLTDKKQKFVYNSVYIVNVDGRLYLEAWKRINNGQQKLSSNYADFDFRNGNGNKTAPAESIRFDYELILDRPTGTIIMSVVPYTTSGYIPQAMISAVETINGAKEEVSLAIFFKFDQDKEREFKFEPLKVFLKDYR